MIDRARPHARFSPSKAAPTAYNRRAGRGPVATQNAKSTRRESSGGPGPEEPPRAVDRLVGLLPANGLEEALEGLEREQIIGPGGLVTGSPVETAGPRAYMATCQPPDLRRTSRPPSMAMLVEAGGCDVRLGSAPTTTSSSPGGGSPGSVLETGCRGCPQTVWSCWEARRPDHS